MGRKSRCISEIVWAAKIALLHLSGILALAALIGPARADTIVVDQAGSATYTTISSGIGAANDGDTVYVLAGLYDEAVDIAKSITLACEGPDLVTIGNTSGTTVTIERSKVVTVTGCRISGAQNGVSLKQNAVVMLSNNIITGNGQNGVQNIECPVASLTMQNNTVSLNAANGIGSVSCGGASANTLLIEDNIVSSNGSNGLQLCAVLVSLTERYNLVFSNGTNYSCLNPAGSDISSNPQFVNATGGDFRLLSGSPARNAGRPGALVDPDGTQNDIGAYGGPGSAGFFPSPEGGPTIRSMSTFPSSVPKNGTITVQATGRANVP